MKSQVKREDVKREKCPHVSRLHVSLGFHVVIPHRITLSFLSLRRWRRGAGGGARLPGHGTLGGSGGALGGRGRGGGCRTGGRGPGGAGGGGGGLGRLFLRRLPAHRLLAVRDLRQAEYTLAFVPL